MTCWKPMHLLSVGLQMSGVGQPTNDLYDKHNKAKYLSKLQLNFYKFYNFAKAKIWQPFLFWFSCLGLYKLWTWNCSASSVNQACGLESVQDFLIKLGIKPLMHLLEISTFSLNNVIVRLTTKIMNRADKNPVHF